ncbi:hypothetical protein NY11_04540 [Listeria monocytogenes]|nr:hypothetical protein [Listeria monocytogenes]
MELDWNQILITFITACIPALIAYATASKQANSKIEEISKNHEAELNKLEKENTYKLEELEALSLKEIEKMKVEFEFNSKSTENDYINTLTNDIMRGKIDPKQIGEAMTQTNRMKKKSQFSNKRKRY